MVITLLKKTLRKKNKNKNLIKNKVKPYIYGKININNSFCILKEEDMYIEC